MMNMGTKYGENWLHCNGETDLIKTIDIVNAISTEAGKAISMSRPGDNSRSRDKNCSLGIDMTKQQSLAVLKG